MNDASNLALPQFLRFISAHPEAGRVAEAMVKGPLAALEARSAIIWMRGDAEHIRIAGAYGTDSRSEVRFSVVPLGVRFPACEAITQQRVLVNGWQDLAAEFPVLQLDGDVWERNRDTSPGGGMITAPILSDGACVGAWATHVRTLPQMSDSFDDRLQAVSGALGLWLTHPHTPIIDAPVAVSGEEPVALTARQRNVLELVLDGLTNAQIADRLHTSRSTIKQDLQRATRSLRTNNRTVAAQRARELGLLGPDPLRAEAAS